MICNSDATVSSANHRSLGSSRDLQPIYAKSFVNRLWLCLDAKIFWQKTSHHMFGHMHGVINGVYLHEWVVNHETNLMSLLNP